MIHVVPSDQCYHFETDWLSTCWHFSFDHYYDPQNVSFGPLRVFNDDTVRPGGGFPTHSHREMEILTIPLQGRLEHEDSEGSHDIIGPGDAQRMSAGTGISHSEFNASREEPVHFLQIWILPAVRGLKPSYEKKSFPAEAREGKFLLVASGDEALRRGNGAVLIHQDASLYLARLSPRGSVVQELRPGRRAYLFVAEGDVTMNGQRLQGGDVARTTAETRLEFEAHKPTELVLIDLP